MASYFSNVTKLVGLTVDLGLSSLIAGDLEIHQSENNVSYKFGSSSIIESMIQTLVIPKFLEIANQKTLESTSLTISERLKESVRLLNSFAHTHETLEECLDFQPLKLVEIAKKIEEKILNALIRHVQANRQFVIRNNTFDANLDLAEKHLNLVFENLFVYFFENNNYDEAFKLIKNIKYSPQCITLLLSIAKKFYSDGNFDKMFETIEEITSPSHEILEILAKLPNEMLSQKFHKTGNKKLKVLIVNTFINQEKILEAQQLIPTLETSDQTDLYKKIIKYYENQNDESSILNIISLFYHESDKTNEYVKIIKKHLKEIEGTDDIETKISSAKQIISRLYHESDKMKQYKKIINIYINLQDYKGAKEIISLMYHESDKKVQYERLIDIYIGSGELNNARNIIGLIYHDSDKKIQYVRLIDIYLKNDDPTNAQNIIPLIYSDSDKTTQYKKIMQHCIAKNDFSQARNLAMSIHSSSDKNKALKNIIKAALKNREFVQFARDTASYITDKDMRRKILEKIDNS